MASMSDNWAVANGDQGNARPSRRSARALGLPHSPFPIPHSHRGLTLIELLVTIVILVTLLAAVLPAVSPNNDARKIREASRQLNTLFAQAQAQAARDNRVVGVGFDDPWIDSNNNGTVEKGEFTGMALEAYILAEPPAFTGFSKWSRVDIGPGTGTYGLPNKPNPGDNANGNGGVLFDPLYRGRELVELKFTVLDGGSPTPDPLPAGTLRIGDMVEIDGSRYLIVDDSDPNTAPNIIDQMTPQLASLNVLASTTSLPLTSLTCILINDQGRFPPPGPRSYAIRRQPAKTSAPALQFPRGVGIDTDPSDGDHSLAIYFAPSGAVDRVVFDGNLSPVRRPFFILLGRVENANPPWQIDATTFDVDNTIYDFSGSVSDDDLAQRRRDVNMLNADSRWVVVTPAGRIVGAENYIFDPRELDPPAYIDGFSPDNGNTPKQQRERQRDGVTDPVKDKFYPGARRYAQQFENETGG
jgi:prepilin-type N-terminal cleavage/methylation domain-containing protein